MNCMRNSAKIVLLAGMALTHFCIAQNSNLELDALLIESSDLMQAGDSQAALALLKRYEQDYSSSPEYLNNLAVAYLGTADAVAAVTILRQLVDSDPIFSIVAHNLIELEMQTAQGPPETINPVLFVQSTESFFEAEIESLGNNNLEQPSSDQVFSSSTNSPAPISTHLQVLRGALQQQTLAWAQAWSNKNLEAYLGFYADTFQPADGSSSREWRIGRSVALSKPGEIQVEVSDFNVFIDGNTATARFTQDYQSSNYADQVEKTLVYSYIDARWKIISETSIPIE